MSLGMGDNKNIQVVRVIITIIDNITISFNSDSITSTKTVNVG